MEKNKNDDLKATPTFYSKKGIITIASIVFVFAVASIIGMYSLGIVRVPEFIMEHFSEELPSGDSPTGIASEGTPPEYLEALPQSEYAKALADMTIPSDMYLSYSITLFSGESSRKTDYTVIQTGESWWVQAAENNVILTTAICKNGKVKITDNASNSSVMTNAYSDTEKGGVSLRERMGIIPLGELVLLIRDVNNSKEVSYGGGITSYSLSYTQSRATSENLFSFSFTTASGLSEEYIFSYERAAIISAKKMLGEALIYKMELSDSRKEFPEIHVNELIKID